MEGTVIRIASESKRGNEQTDSLTEVPRAIGTLVTHNREVENLIVLEDDTELTPYEGMEFESEDAARDFYSTYARSAGFRIRISRYTRSRRDNSVISRRIVCSKEGFHETRACDGLHPEQKQQERAGTRVGCKAMILIKKFSPGKWVVTKFIKNHNHGPVPPRKLDSRLVDQDCDPMEKPHSIEVDPVEEPFEGMEFESEEAAKLFYVNYARLNGFRARISRYCRSRRDNSIISRQIVCSKEGFREVRTKKVLTDEGKTKRPRMITRVGCKAMIVVKKMNSGKWMVSKFEKEHNHSLSYSKMVPSTSNITSGEIVDLAAKGAHPSEVKNEGYSAGTQCNPADSLTILYNNLCQEAIKFAKEGSVTEEIYHVAVSALKEAAEKVAEVKRSRPTLSHCGFVRESKHDVLQEKSMSALQCSNQVELTRTSPGSRPLQDSASNLLLIPTDILTDSRLYSGVDTAPLTGGFPTNESESTHASESSFMHFKNTKKTSSEKSQHFLVFHFGPEDAYLLLEPQNTCFNQLIHGKEQGIHGSSKDTMVAIPAIPLALCMPVTQSLPGSSTEGPYRLLAAPIEAVPISYCPAEPIRQTQKGICALGPFGGVLSELKNQGTVPKSIVHATALACGARAVPLEDAASLISAIESKIRSGGAIIAKLPSNNLAPLVPPAIAMSSSSEDDEEHDHSEPSQ
ncbi:Far-red impaired responsive (FAR1) family protein [Zea mays]|uniref:Far-red impaired responsive (FAR1) family protein n=1 Tax=Zea mays TaxID=4577 RepID=A0A1D6JWH8_MAIZE|nr:Far-red impaired responsive (FAR1) family protein [Zea mays]